MTDDTDEVQRRWDADVAQSQQEDGTSYSGEIGMLVGPIVWNDTPFDSRDEAWNWLMENHRDKWGPPTAVRFTEGDRTGWVVGGTASS